MARAGWTAEHDRGFTLSISSRRQKPPAATPWGKLELEWRRNVSQKFYWRGSLKEVLVAASDGMRYANDRKHKTGKGGRWESVDAFLYGWAKARRWIMVMDPSQDLLTIRPDPGKPPPKQEPPKTDAIQPSLFDLD